MVENRLCEDMRHPDPNVYTRRLTIQTRAASGVIRDSRIQCYIKKIGIHHYRACKAKVDSDLQLLFTISMHVTCLHKSIPNVSYSLSAKRILTGQK